MSQLLDTQCVVRWVSFSCGLFGNLDDGAVVTWCILGSFWHPTNQVRRDVGCLHSGGVVRDCGACVPLISHAWSMLVP